MQHPPYACDRSTTSLHTATFTRRLTCMQGALAGSRHPSTPFATLQRAPPSSSSSASSVTASFHFSTATQHSLRGPPSSSSTQEDSEEEVLNDRAHALLRQMSRPASISRQPSAAAPSGKLPQQRGSSSEKFRVCGNSGSSSSSDLGNCRCSSNRA